MVSNIRGSDNFDTSDVTGFGISGWGSTRSTSTNYTNSKSHPIMVIVSFNMSSGISINIDGTSFSTHSYANFASVTFLVPAGSYYNVSNPYGSQYYLRELD